MTKELPNPAYPLDRYALRGLSYPQQQAARAARSAYLAEQKVAKRAVQRTCQVCGRMIYAEVGVIAHHGYERPERGAGWQTASCIGARELPFEKSRDVLGAYIKDARAMSRARATVLGRMRAETVDFTLSWTEHTGGPSAWDRIKEEKSLNVNRATNFDQLRIDYPKAFAGRRSMTFDDVKASAIMTAERDLELLDQHIAEQQERFDLWQQVEF